MSDERLSALQKWILTHCYMVTVLFDHSSLLGLDGRSRYCCSGSYSCAAKGKGNEKRSAGIPGVALCRDGYGAISNKCDSNEGYTCECYQFYIEDVLRSFYRLEVSAKEASERKQHFVDCPEYRRAHAALSRSLKALVSRGYICVHKLSHEPMSSDIRLSDKGARKAAGLLDIECIDLEGLSPG